MKKSNAHTGFTLLEMLAAISILAITVTIAIPAMNNLNIKNRLKGSSEKLYTDIQLARSEALKINNNIILSTTSTCYGFDVTPSCDCSTNACLINTSLSKGISFSSSYTGTINFGPRGKITDAVNNIVSGSFTLTATNSTSVSLKLSGLGQIKLCSDTVSSYPNCPPP